MQNKQKNDLSQACLNHMTMPIRSIVSYDDEYGFDNDILFGTDGIRGTVNIYPVRADIILKLGTMTGWYFKQLKIKKCVQKCNDKEYVQNVLNDYHNKTNQHKIKCKAVVVKDTRLSGYLVEPALTAGLVSAGIDVELIGPMPTPAVPMLIKSLRADFGIMITASHNPSCDNGLKIFDGSGLKISADIEREIQRLMVDDAVCIKTHNHKNNIDDDYCNDDCCEVQRDEYYKYRQYIDFTSKLALPHHLGRVKHLDDATGRYIEHVKGAFPHGKTLADMRIVLDCANGSCYKIAPTIMWEFGADVHEIGCRPNGLNINEGCGAMHPELLQKKVLQCKAHVGFAFDGDGDRLLVCDEFGKIVHGDHILAFIALHLLKHNRLIDSCVVVTCLSNTALLDFLKQHNIHSHITTVGDKNVVSKMREVGCSFGGESSGHIVIGKCKTTGDGILSALCVLAAILELGIKVSDISKLFVLRANISFNIGFIGKNPLLKRETSVKMRKIISDAESDDARIIVRPSGTESVIRVYIEGGDNETIQCIAEKVRKTINEF